MFESSCFTPQTWISFCLKHQGRQTRLLRPTVNASTINQFTINYRRNRFVVHAGLPFILTSTAPSFAKFSYADAWRSRLKLCGLHSLNFNPDLFITRPEADGNPWRAHISRQRQRILFSPSSNNCFNSSDRVFKKPAVSAVQPSIYNGPRTFLLRTDKRMIANERLSRYKDTFFVIFRRGRVREDPKGLRMYLSCTAGFSFESNWTNERDQWKKLTMICEFNRDHSIWFSSFRMSPSAFLLGM